MNSNAATNDATRDTTEGLLSRQGVALPIAAKALNVSLRTVQRRLDKGELRFIERDGRRFVLLEREDVELDKARDSDAAPRQNDATRDTTGAERSEREKELREEIAFLRGVIEQLQRDGAETRAALRKALELAPKQLAQGTEESARNAPERPQNGETGNYGPDALNGSQTGRNRGETALTYADIANQLEEELNQDGI